MRAQALAVLILTVALVAAAVCRDTPEPRETTRFAAAPSPISESAQHRIRSAGPPYFRAPRRGHRP